MPRIQIELTSARPDGSWTWRVARARQPKGTLAADLIPSGAKVGDVLRAEADVELEGTVITSVLAAPGKRPEREKLEIVGTPTPFEAVTTSLLPKGARPRRGPSWDGGETRRDDRPRAAGSRVGGPPRRDRPSTAPDTTSAGEARSDDRPSGGAARRDGPPTRGEPRRDERPGRGGPRRDERPRTGEAAPGSGRSGSGRPAAPRRTERDQRESASPDGPHRSGPRHDSRQAPASPPRPKRLTPANTNRTAVLATLAPEERPVAEQLLHGGIPAVRRALQEQNAKARAEGQPEVKTDAIVALAEELLPRIKAAEWRDRADAAVADLEELSLRDLRSVVAGADAARDDETRLLAKTLRDALERREAKERQDWLDEITTSVTEGRVVRALRLSARPPDPRTRFPADLVGSLSEAAGAALTTDAPADRWMTVLEAVLESPVRRSVKPAGIPADPAALNAARQASGRVPALAVMLGIDMPPPPGPLRQGARPTRPPNRSGQRPGGLPPRRPIPPPPAPRSTGTSRPEGAPTATPTQPESAGTGEQESLPTSELGSTPAVPTVKPAVVPAVASAASALDVDMPAIPTPSEQPPPSVEPIEVADTVDVEKSADVESPVDVAEPVAVAEPVDVAEPVAVAEPVVTEPVVYANEATPPGPAG